MQYPYNTAIMFLLKAAVVVTLFAFVEMGEHDKLAYWYRNGGPNHGIFAEDADLPA